MKLASGHFIKEIKKQLKNRELNIKIIGLDQWKNLNSEVKKIKETLDLI